MKLLACVALAASAALAQTATLNGRVSDESGALVPGATVAVNGPGGLSRTTKSGDTGAYSFVGLPAGDYVLQASAPDLGMLPAKIALNAGSQIVNLTLKLAATMQQITVEYLAGPAVSTDASSNASAVVLRGDDLQALSDDPEDLQADLQALAGPSAGPSGGAIFIDGFSGGQLPAKSSIREIRVNQNPFSPEYDKLGFGRVEILTKPGTDKLRGSVVYNFADDFWNSRNPYAAQKATLLLNELETNLSGPLGRRASFTLDVQRHSVDNGAIINAIDPNALAPFTDVFTTPQRRDNVSPRLDYQINERNTLTIRYQYLHSDVRGFGIGGFDLVSRGVHREIGYQTGQVTETAVIGATINETRFQFFRSANDTLANSNAPKIQVLGAFSDGGSVFGHTLDTQNYYELQNITSMVRGAHAWKFGFRLRAQTDDNISPLNFNGTFTFDSLDQYRLGHPAQFSINAGTPGLAGNLVDLGAFMGDDWRVRPNLTLNLGLRYETQTNIHDSRDIAPRVGFAWAPGAGVRTSRPGTVLRGGFGMFYDRFALANTLAAERYNGILQQQYVLTCPCSFYPKIPPASALAGSQSPQVIQQVDSRLRAPYIMQSAFTVERQLPANTTLAVSFTNSHGLHSLRSLDINAPLQGAFPYGTSNPIFLMTSSGLYNQNQVYVNVNSKLNAAVSFFGFYVWNKAMSNTDGLGTYPANPYNWTGEYGPASSDIRHRVSLGGSINTRWNIRFNPLVTVQSGPPYDITVGRDLYGTTLFNGRAGIATDLSRPGLIPSSYGLLDPNPAPGERILSRNYGRGPGFVSVNLRVGKTFGFGPEKSSGATRGGGAGPPQSGPGGPSNVPLYNVFGNPAVDRRYNLTISMSARNVFNRNNPGPVIGNITSPLFGQANQMYGGANGEGFSENANNRRLEMQIRFTF